MHSPWRRLLMAALAATAALAAFGTASALAASNEVAYRCDLDICLLDPDNSSAVTNLTDNGGASLDEMPAWSPDGTKLAFVSRFSANTRNVFVMEPGAAGEGINLAVQVTNYTDGGYLNDPVWSPDGTRIAFVRGTDEGSRSVRVAASNGTTGTPVTIAEHGQHPSWAPDGGKIAYSYGKQVFLKNADSSGSATPLENAAGREPAWSPDGSKIAFDFPAHPSEFVDLHIVSSIGGGTPVVVPSNTQWTFAAWSPDGSKIAYRSTSENYGYFRVVNADGSGDHPLPIVIGQNDNGREPSWSPDGSRLVYQGFNGSTTDLYVANTNGFGPALALTSDGNSYEPVWRPQPHVQVVTPSNGSAAPIPATIKPKIVWITKRIHWTPGLDPNLNIGNYGCAGLACSVGTEGRTKYAGPPSVLPRPSLIAGASGRPKKKPKTVVVGLGKMTVKPGQTRPLKMRLTKAGIALLTKQGSLAIAVTVTTTGPGRSKTTAKKTIHVVYDMPKKKHKHG